MIDQAETKQDTYTDAAMNINASLAYALTIITAVRSYKRINQNIFVSHWAN